MKILILFLFSLLAAATHAMAIGVESDDALAVDPTPPSYYRVKAADVGLGVDRRSRGEYDGDTESDDGLTVDKRTPPSYYRLKEADTEAMAPGSHRKDGYYRIKESDAVANNEARAAPGDHNKGFYRVEETDTGAVMPRDRHDGYYRVEEADAEAHVEERTPPIYYRVKEADAETDIERRTPPIYYRVKEADAETDVERRTPPIYYRVKEADTGPELESRTPPSYYRVKEADTGLELESRTPPSYYRMKEADTELGENPQSRDVKIKSPVEPLRNSISRAVLSREIKAGSLNKRSQSLGEHKAKANELHDWVYEKMRTDSLREISDRARKLLEYEVTPASDQVDRQHVPEHLTAMMADALNEQEKVSLLNFYLQVTGREPRPASELGWNRTRETPTLLETEEVGYGYALGSQHQLHCADVLADAVDLGKAHINDLYLVHVSHCLALMKIYAGQLTAYREPLLPLTTYARTLLDSGYAMDDWADEDLQIIKHGMLHPDETTIDEASTAPRPCVCEPSNPRFDAWIVALIAEAVAATLGLAGMVGWMLMRRQRAAAAPSPEYMRIGTAVTDDEK